MTLKEFIKNQTKIDELNDYTEIIVIKKVDYEEKNNEYIHTNVKELLNSNALELDMELYAITSNLQYNDRNIPVWIVDEISLNIDERIDSPLLMEAKLRDIRKEVRDLLTHMSYNDPNVQEKLKKEISNISDIINTLYLENIEQELEKYNL